MFNISKISNKNFLGKLLRLPLGIIPKNTIVKILQGPNKGFKWVKGSGNNSYWLGTYEIDKQIAIKNSLRENLVFYDIGAHVGFFTLLAARRVKEYGFVVAFEPFDKNIAYLETHVSLNKLGNVIIKRGVVASKPGHLFFKETGSSAGGHIADEGKSISAYSIDDLVASGLRKPDVVKIDVQGATLLVLQGMEKTLSENDIKLFVAIDNAPRKGLSTFSKKDTHNFFKSKGYEVVDIKGKRIPNDRLEEINEIVAYKKSKSAKI